MHCQCDNFSVSDRDEVVVLSLPDGSSVRVPKDTVRRSALLQEAIQAETNASSVSISLPRGVLQDWLQSVDALKAAPTSTGQGADIAGNPRLLQLLKVCTSVCVPVSASRSRGELCMPAFPTFEGKRIRPRVASSDTTANCLRYSVFLDAGLVQCYVVLCCAMWCRGVIVQIL